MTNPEIRKLLAGYATNSLTEAERKALFHAALNDQELFDQLHNEQAVKDVLDDPISRAQIRQALDQPAIAPRAWWTRWWAWSSAVAAVAASVLVVSVIRSRPPDLSKELATLNTAPAPQPPSPAAKTASDAESKRESARLTSAPKRNQRKDVSPPPRPAPPPAPQTPVAQQEQVGSIATPQAAPLAGGRAVDQQVQVETVPAQAAKTFSDEKQKQVAPIVVFPTASNFATSGVAGSPLTYTVLKLNAAGTYEPSTKTALKAGDSIRFVVTPTLSGHLVLNRVEATGGSTPVYPETGQGIAVTAFNSYTIPVSSIQVQPSNQRFRITLVPAVKAKATNPPAFTLEINLTPTVP
jgi:hypothetical protein